MFILHRLCFSSDIRLVKNKLRKGLASLPRPRNDYEIVAPDDVEQSESDVSSVVDDGWIEDASDVAAYKRQKHKEESNKVLIFPFLISFQIS